MIHLRHFKLVWYKKEIKCTLHTVYHLSWIYRAFCTGGYMYVQLGKKKELDWKQLNTKREFSLQNLHTSAHLVGANSQPSSEHTSAHVVLGMRAQNVQDCQKLPKHLLQPAPKSLYKIHPVPIIRTVQYYSFYHIPNLGLSLHTKLQEYKLNPYINSYSGVRNG